MFLPQTKYRRSEPFLWKESDLHPEHLTIDAQARHFSIDTKNLRPAEKALGDKHQHYGLNERVNGAQNEPWPGTQKVKK